MKKLLLFCLLVFLFSCEKEEEKVKEPCWICIDQYNTALPPISTVIVCDPVEAAAINGNRWKDAWGVWHLIKCTPQ